MLLTKFLKHKQLKDFPLICSRLTGTDPYGPNCWNATMLILGKKRKPEYIDAEPMDAWLKENTKRVRIKKAKAKMILVMYSGKRLVHTAVYINDEGLMWHKSGYAGTYEVATEERVKTMYVKPHNVTKIQIRELK